VGSQTSKQTTETKPPAWSKPLFEQSASEAQKFYNSGKGGNVYNGDTTAGLGSTTTGGINRLQQAVAGMPSGTSSGSNLLDMASGSYLKNGNPYFNSALQGQLDQTENQVQSSFSGAGRYGSGANTGVLTQQLGNVRASAMSDQFNRDTGNMLTANGQIDQANSNQFQNRLAGEQAVIGAGQLQDASHQADLDAKLQRFQARDNKDWTRLGLLQSAAAGSAGNYGVSSGTSQQPSNMLATIGGIASTAAKRSDIRLKENIERVGEKNGFPLYEWNYRNHAQRYRGVMAQDVLTILPDAVTVTDDGYLAVFYDRIGVEMEAVECRS
jgi:hypothetical protein